MATLHTFHENSYWLEFEIYLIFNAREAIFTLCKIVIVIALL